MTERTGHRGYTLCFVLRHVWMPWKVSLVVDERFALLLDFWTGKA